MHAALLPPNYQATAGGRSAAVIHQLRRSAIFRTYQEAFETSTGLPLVLRPLGSFHFPLVGSRSINSFHALASHINRWCAACLELEDRLEHVATTETTTLELFGGVQETAIPVRMGECLLGHLRTGQVFLRPPTKGNFDDIVRRLGVPLPGDVLSKLESAYLQTRVIAEKQYQAALELLSIFSGHLAAIGNQLLVSDAQSEIPGIAKARVFIEQHLTEKIRLEDVAHAASMSPFYFCKVFHRMTGLTFTDYLARRRVETVKEALLNPNMRVCEAAYAAGFQSLSQFNRVFRRIAGKNPLEFRHGVHEHESHSRNRRQSVSLYRRRHRHPRPTGSAT